MRLRTHIYDKRGMSLVEVLAALAVFVIGILVIVRLFPPGFFVVKQSENFTLANRLAQSELERLKGTTANLPAGILGWDIVRGGVLINMNPEDMDDLPGLAAGHNAYYYSDVNKFRRIYSESTKIPAPMTTPAWGDVSLYVMNFSPIEWNGPNSIVVRSGPMRRRDIPESPAKIRNSSDYAIDYDAAVLHLRPMTYDREFVITYSYWVRPGGTARPELRPVLSARVLVPANADMVDIPNANQPGFMEIDQGSDTLHRAFNEIPLANAWSANPYEYKVIDSTRGVLAFNPAGYGYDEVTAWGTVALTAYIDYDMLDWHIIREERKIPETALITSQADLEAKLTLRSVKNAGLTNVANPGYPTTVELDGSNYAGLAPSTALSPGLPFSILAIDIQTGEWFNEESHVPPPGNTNNFVMTVNYKDGIIRFDRDMAGRTFRIYYRAEGDWALQVFKTYESYRRSYNFNGNSSTPLDHREWWGSEDTDTASDKVPFFNERIYFARCYSGMSVALDYTYRIKYGGTYTYFSVDGDTYQTTDNGRTAGTCYIDPRDRIARLRGVSISDVEITQIAKVYGVSVGARVIWREGGRGFRGGQWRKVDLQTYLMRLQD